jgi:hypothetical protein
MAREVGQRYIAGRERERDFILKPLKPDAFANGALLSRSSAGRKSFIAPLGIFFCEGRGLGLEKAWSFSASLRK